VPASDNILQAIFILSVFMIVWPYFGYPVFLMAISYVRGIKVEKDEIYPSISMVITAYNEEKQIKNKIENSLRLEYPKDKFEIIIASDHSTDNTDEIIKNYVSHGVQLLTFPKRRGKHYCQVDAVNVAKGEIIVFSDVACLLPPDSVKNIVSNFADKKIGVVSGMDKIEDADGVVRGEGVYVRYEMLLRELESKVGSLVGASGSYYAIRKSICSISYPHLSSDFYLPILAYKSNFRSILDRSAIGYYKVTDDPSKEFQRKVRTLVHGFDVLIKFRYILNPFRYGLYAIQMLSHKLSRWLVPFVMIIAFLSNLLLVNHNHIFSSLFALQVLFYGIAATAFFYRNLQEQLVFKIIYFFVMTNFSILVAAFKFMAGERYISWESTKR